MASLGGDRRGALVHPLGLFTWIVGPLVVYLVTDDEFIAENARQAFNWQVFVAVYLVVSGALVLVLVGFLLLPLVVLANLVFCTVAAVKALRGETWQYPLTRELL